MKNNEVTLSIIIPTYNRVKYLASALNSIVGIKHIKEVIIIDDNSSDNTELFINNFKPDYPLKYLKNESNRGAPYSRNRGIKQSSGTHVLFLDSDDVLNPSGINTVLEWFCQINYDYVYGVVEKVDSLLNPFLTPLKYGKNWNIYDTKDIVGYHWCTHGIVYRKAFLDKVGYWNEALTGSQDWELQCRVKMASKNFIFYDILFGLWRDHYEARIGTKQYNANYIESVFKACQTIYSKIKTSEYDNKQTYNALSRNLFFHILEASANKNKTLKQIGIKLNKSITHKSSYIYKITNFLLQFSISAIDGLIFKLITKRDIQ